MMHEAFVPAVWAEQVREREYALLLHRLQAGEPRPEAQPRLRLRLRRVFGFRTADLVGFLSDHRRQPRSIAAADLADRTVAG